MRISITFSEGKLGGFGVFGRFLAIILTESYPCYYHVEASELSILSTGGRVCLRTTLWSIQMFPSDLENRMAHTAAARQ